MNDAEKDILRTAVGILGTFLGAVLTKLGLDKRKRRMFERDDEQDPRPAREGRTITREEWHDLRDTVHKAVWEIANFKLYLEKELGRMEQTQARDHERIGNMSIEVSLLKERLEHLEEQLDRLSDRFQPARPEQR